MVDKYDLANMFNSYTDINDNELYNLLKTLHIKDNIATAYYYWYEIQEKDTWQLISYKAYQTPKLWWIICKVNGNFQPMVNAPEAGDKIKILTKEIVDVLLQNIRGYKNK